MPSNNTVPPQEGGPRELKLLTPLHKGPTSPAPTAPSPSPLTPPPQSPPPTPCPWLWRCHSCYTIYRLAVTRRCLDCDHTFCLGDDATTPAGGPNSDSNNSRKRKRGGGPCKAEFDYTGWKRRGAWRRTRLLNSGGDNNNDDRIVNTSNDAGGKEWGDEYEAATGGDTTLFDARRDHLFLRRQHDCFLHCDFPSECHHALIRARHEGRPVLREALALDGARARALAAVADTDTDKNTTATTEQGGGNRRLRLNVRRGSLVRARRGHSAAATRKSPEEDLVLLPRVDEGEEDTNNDSNSVSPCSPTSPDPPGDLMREVQVSPIEGDNNEDDQPVSPGGGGGRQQRRRSLLVATDTPADFATTAAPLCFDEDTTSSEDDEAETRQRKSRRKVAQLTGEAEAGVLGPFMLDALSPTSPVASTEWHHHYHHHDGPAAASDELQAAYSEQAWFSTCTPPPSSSSSSQQPTVTTTISAGPPSHSSPRSPERVGKRDRMLALLGRRPGVSAHTRGDDASNNNNIRVRQQQQQQQQHQHQQHVGARTVGEEWESWSDSSPSCCSAASGSDTTDADGDVPMRDAGADALSPSSSSSPWSPQYGDGESPVTPVTPPPPPGRHRGGEGEADEDLNELLRMRNAFMRGEMK